LFVLVAMVCAVLAGSSSAVSGAGTSVSHRPDPGMTPMGKRWHPG
jgi:hypothetical protein